MYIVTGGAGFIGSAFVWRLNQEGIEDILIVDELDQSEKWQNLRNLKFQDYVHKDEFPRLMDYGAFPTKVEAIIHMGACSSTTETDSDFLYKNNFRYTRSVAEFCLENSIRFLYASSAATYGDGSAGYADDQENLRALKPLNMYGYSKQLFDLWAVRNGSIGKMAGFKFFNVYGPNEYHKDDMRSVVCKAFEQISDIGSVKLFKSYKPEYGDGEQVRDFVYVKDAVEVMWWFLQNPEVNGLYNLGTGQARSWKDLANATFAAMDRSPNIEFIEMPESLRDKYQYHTQAEMAKLRDAGCDHTFRTLEEGVDDYVRNYLAADDRYL
jgi:ADP-L-glycero-D-manno-heptose 6-epimerase